MLPQLATGRGRPRETFDVCGVAVTVSERVCVDGEFFDYAYDEESGKAAMAYGDTWRERVANAFALGVVVGKAGAQ